MSDEINRVKQAELPLQRDLFLRTLIGHLAGTLQDVVGAQEAAGFISVVGQSMGKEMDESYKKALNIQNLNRAQLSAVLVDLKRRIQGDFYVIEESDEKIVFGNRKCPFGEKVHGRPTLCMMTSNVFGSIAARNTGYGKVELRQTIAQGAEECRVVVYLKPSEKTREAKGREYYREQEE